ncbi:hypothetical protein [Streptomyces sp. NRRL S-495]|uniref:hypothetical protein n=1 Tax=Streptomyces sp. NRRL S-495 TaxID=1609133 RepID=UPI00133163FE|nr:hypothetical protein [Streptomyces sp. NRRL S-495]
MNLLGARWLASANRWAGDAFRAWRSGQLAAIEVGGRFAVVRVLDQQLGIAALRDMQAAGVVTGPVLCDDRRLAVEFLIAARRDEPWQIRDSLLIGRSAGSFPAITVPMPGPGLPGVDGRTWLVPPTGLPPLTHPHDLASALRRARTPRRRARQLAR